MRLSRLIPLLALATIYPLSNASTCPKDSGQVCKYTIRSKSETPVGQIDGHNVYFDLNEIPEPQMPVRGFLNGIQEVIGQDYQISGAHITFLSGHAPVPGDVLNFFFFVRTPADNPTDIKGTPRAAEGTAAQGQYDPAVADQLILRAMAHEMALSGPTSPVRQEPAVAERSEQKVIPPRTAKGQGASMRMLLRRIQRADALGKRKGHKSDQNGLIGVDGLGDQESYSIFSLLNDESASAARSDGVVTGKPSGAGSGRAAAEPASLRMLATRIARSSSEDPSDDRSSSAPQPPSE